MARTEESKQPRGKAAPVKDTSRRTTASTAKETVTGQTKAAQASGKGVVKNGGVECPQCGKIISRKADLPRHQRLHMPKEEVSLVCSWVGCDYSTIQKSNLATHYLTHTKETPYNCPVEGCSFETRDRASLTRHKKTFHDYKPDYASHGGRSRPGFVPRQTLPTFTAPPSKTSSSETSPSSSPSFQEDSLESQAAFFAQYFTPDEASPMFPGNSIGFLGGPQSPAQGLMPNWGGQSPVMSQAGDFAAYSGGSIPPGSQDQYGASWANVEVSRGPQAGNPGSYESSLPQAGSSTPEESSDEEFFHGPGTESFPTMNSLSLHGPADGGIPTFGLWAVNETLSVEGGNYEMTNPSSSSLPMDSMDHRNPITFRPEMGYFFPELSNSLKAT